MAFSGVRVKQVQACRLHGVHGLGKWFGVGVLDMRGSGFFCFAVLVSHSGSYSTPIVFGTPNGYCSKCSEL